MMGAIIIRSRNRKRNSWIQISVKLKNSFVSELFEVSIK